MNETKNHSKSILFAFISIFIISAIAYLPKVLELGFYRDDWYLLYTGNVLGADHISFKPY